MLWNTPSAENTKYTAATATKRMTHPTNEIMKLNFMTDHGSILDSTSCASRTSSAASCLAPFGASSAAALRSAAAGLLLTLTADLPLPTAPPGFPTVLGFRLFLPGLANGFATLNFVLPD